MPDRPTLTPAKKPIERLSGGVGWEFRFDATEDVPAYQDTLWDEPGREFSKMTAVQRTAEMNARYDNWAAIVNAPPVEVSPEEQLAAAQADALAAERASLEARMRFLDLQEQIAQVNTTGEEA